MELDRLQRAKMTEVLDKVVQALDRFNGYGYEGYEGFGDSKSKGEVQMSTVTTRPASKVVADITIGVTKKVEEHLPKVIAMAAAPKKLCGAATIK